MRLTTRHLRIALAILVASLIYNLWALTRSSAPRRAPNQAPVLQNTSAQPQNQAPTESPATAAASIPAPPTVELAPEPRWSRDPFTSVKAPPSAAAVVPAPVIGPTPRLQTILFASNRRAALVGNRVVGVGDEVSSGTIVAIERYAIVVRHAAGEERVELRPTTVVGGLTR